MKKIILAAFVFIFALGIGVAAAQQATPHYDVASEKAAVAVDGKVDEAVWAQVGAIDGSFHFPWEAVKAPRTIFKAFHDAQNFYFSFVVYDADIVAQKAWKGESTVDNEDRVELFFAPSAVDKPAVGGLPAYYAIEVDPLGRVHDYSTVYYRHMDSAWKMQGLRTTAVIEDGKYTVEGAIPLQTLKALKLIDANGVMRTGVYRAEFSQKKEGLDMRWISWVDPKTPEPDYHVDSSFGEFRFLQ